MWPIGMMWHQQVPCLSPKISDSGAPRALTLNREPGPAASIRSVGSVRGRCTRRARVCDTGVTTMRRRSTSGARRPAAALPQRLSAPSRTIVSTLGSLACGEKQTLHAQYRCTQDGVNKRAPDRSSVRFYSCDRLGPTPDLAKTPSCCLARGAQSATAATGSIHWLDRCKLALVNQLCMQRRHA